MKYREEKINLFSLKSEWYLAHCISSDCKMGAGIAVEFNKRFKLKEKLLEDPVEYRKSPTCILENRVFNLITKNKYYDKPTYSSITLAIEKMSFLCKYTNVDKIAMPRIGCGLDGLQWPKVREILKGIFNNEEIEILVCYI